jgi:hypothetical protein
VLVIIATVNIPICLSQDAQFVGWKEIFTTNNTLALACIILILTGLIFLYQFNHKLKNSSDGLPIAVTKVENLNHEYVSLFLTLLTIIAFDFSTIRGIIQFLLVLFVLGAIFIMTELFYSNPSFALLGFHIYRVTTNHSDIIPENSILISRNELKTNEKVNYIKISDTVFYCQKANTQAQ